MISLLWVLRFPLPSIPPVAPHSSSTIRGWYSRPVIALVKVDSVPLHPPHQKKKKRTNIEDARTCGSECHIRDAVIVTNVGNSGTKVVLKSAFWGICSARVQRARVETLFALLYGLQLSRLVIFSRYRICCAVRHWVQWQSAGWRLWFIASPLHTVHRSPGTYAVRERVWRLKALRSSTLALRSHTRIHPSTNCVNEMSIRNRHSVVKLIVAEQIIPHVL
jgi:hypothetical protein